MKTRPASSTAGRSYFIYFHEFFSETKKVLNSESYRNQMLISENIVDATALFRLL